MAVAILTMLGQTVTPINMWNTLSYEQKVDTELETKAWVVCLTEEEFKLFSAVVEAESDRTDNLEAKTFVALTIWNRKNSSDWPNTITGVITQSGQFTVYYEGIYKSVGRTELSDLAIVEAYNMIDTGDYPNVIYFNSIGYNGLGTPYACIGDNYFSTVP